MELYLDPTWKKIGISLSGGADSALLAYLILKETNADIYFTTQVRMWKTRPWQRYVAKDVVSWFQERFKNRIEQIEGFIPPEMEEPNTTYITDEYGKTKPGNRIILRAHNEWVVHTHNLDAWFAAVNKNPDIAIVGALEERNDGVLPLQMKHMGIDICHPFVYTTKDWIIKQYYENNIEDLLDITRSCEGEFDGLDYTSYTPGQDIPICGECFWCKEREWAIEQAK
jgi:hypothetical protein|tara:strand:- start:46 stop:723 length:678 start_codon:yes stop_codon:yes gene_type:complete